LKNKSTDPLSYHVQSLYYTKLYKIADAQHEKVRNLLENRTGVQRTPQNQVHDQNCTHTGRVLTIYLVFDPRAGWLALLKYRRWPDVGEPHEVLPAGSRGGHRGVQHRRPSPALVEVGDAGQARDVRREARLDLPGLQFPPVYRLEPLVVLYLVAATGAAAQPLVGFFVQQLKWSD
jgi:hypothetical protein